MLRCYKADILVSSESHDEKFSYLSGCLGDDGAYFFSLDDGGKGNQMCDKGFFQFQFLI